jgi:uncharacterized protein (TIGR02001 family)
MTSLRTLLAASALAAIFTTPALAQDASTPPADPAAAQSSAPATTPDFTVTGSAGVWSQYRFRGISQSDNLPVFQGALTLSHKSGFYLSTWGSSASANDAVNIGGSEIDVYAGYTHALGKSGVTFDGGLYGYLYPGSGRATGISENYYEVYGSLSKPVGPVTAKIGLNWAPHQAYFDNWNTASRYNMYEYGELSVSVPHMPVSLHGHLGHTGGGLDYLGHDYLDYTVGASYKWKMLTFDLSVVGTSLSRDDTRVLVDDGAGDLVNDRDYWRAAKTALVGSVSSSF